MTLNFKLNIPFKSFIERLICTRKAEFKNIYRIIDLVNDLLTMATKCNFSRFKLIFQI